MTTGSVSAAVHPGPLGAAVNAFDQAARTTIGELRSQADALAGGLRGAAHNYEQIDCSLFAN